MNINKLWERSNNTLYVVSDIFLTIWIPVSTLIITENWKAGIGTFILSLLMVRILRREPDWPVIKLCVLLLSMGIQIGWILGRTQIS